MSDYYEVTEKDFEMTEQEMWDYAMSGVHEYETEDLPEQAIECLFKREDISWKLKEQPLHKFIFYWLKTLLCLCFRRLNGDYTKSYFCALSWGEHGNGECGGTSWDACYVGEGVFKNWQVQIMRDST